MMESKEINQIMFFSVKQSINCLEYNRCFYDRANETCCYIVKRLESGIHFNQVPGDHGDSWDNNDIKIYDEY